MSRWFRAVLWVQLASLLSPYAAVVVATAVNGPGGCGEVGCGHAHAAMMALAAEVYSIPTALVLAYAFGGRRIDGGRLAWLLATDAWLLLITAVVVRSSNDALVFVIPGAIITATATVTAAGSVVEWMKLRRVRSVTTLKT